MDFSDDEVLPAAKRAAQKVKERKLSREDKINLRMEDDNEDDDEDELDEAVYDIKGADDSSEDEDDDDLDEDQLTGLAAKMAKQAKYLKRKAGAAGIDDEDEEDSEEDEKAAAWGKKKRAYYSADNVDCEIQSDDEEAPLEEEQEALRLQRKAAGQLRPEDYGQEDDEGVDEGEDEDGDEHEETMQEALHRSEKMREAKKKRGEKSTKQKPSKKGEEKAEEMAVEKVAKDVNALSKEQQMAVIMSEAPELVGLLAELKEGLSEVRTKVEPLLEQVKAGDHATTDGISYLEAKYLLLLSYCQCIVFYLLLKAEGRSVREHPVIARLVEIRMYLEKIRPIDKKLQYQIEKLLKAAKRVGADTDKATEDGKDAGLTFRPNPDLLVAKIDQSAEDGGVYRPPMMAPASMEDEEGGARERRNKMRASRDAQRRAVQSSFVQELAADIEGRPEEVREVLGNESQEMLRERARLAKRMEVEENLMARVPLSREERKKFKHLKSRSSNGLLGMLDDFDDDVAGLVEMDDAPAAVEPRRPRPLMQAIAEAGRPVKKVTLTSGDADLPTRADLGERRRKRELQSIPKGGVDDDGDDGSGGSPVEWEEDPVYTEAKQLRAAKLAAKAEKYQRKPGVVPAEEETAEGKRNITREMEKNRGLTPHRKKLTKNPRKKYKLKFGKAVVRRKGQVREVKSQSAPYGGEATGIKSNISRSVRFAKG